MCGIAGIVATDGLREEERARLPRMRDVIAHRGPDEAGAWFDAFAALGHRRLSIVDLASGSQPLGNEDGTVQIVFNGEIYNHADLRPELEAAGHRYHTRCDTEAIVHAYEEWGDDCVHRFRGMFAFAIWDAPRRRLLLARDRVGIKPLYWTVRHDRLIFGSEIKAILASGLVEPQANESGLPELLGTRYLSGEETLFTGIHKLLPGHLLVYEQGRVTTRQYLGRAGGGGRSPAGAERPRMGVTVSRAAGRVRSTAVDVGCAARHVPLRRSRQQRDRGPHGADDRSPAADLLGRVQGARVQRADVVTGGGAGGRCGHPRDRHRGRPVLRRAAQARVARRRTHRTSVERAALFRVGPRSRARHGRAHRRGQRRAAGGVREVPAGPAELEGGRALRAR